MHSWVPEFFLLRFDMISFFICLKSICNPMQELIPLHTPDTHTNTRAHTFVNLFGLCNTSGRHATDPDWLGSLWNPITWATFDDVAKSFRVASWLEPLITSSFVPGVCEKFREIHLHQCVRCVWGSFRSQLTWGWVEMNVKMLEKCILWYLSCMVTMFRILTLCFRLFDVLSSRLLCNFFGN